MKACRIFRIEGRVQGVWFRESTRRRALPLGLTGHAINRTDGSVEVLACGALADIETLGKWLATGPRLARVDAVLAGDIDCEPPHSFETG